MYNCKNKLLQIFLTNVQCILEHVHHLCYRCQLHKSLLELPNRYDNLHQFSKNKIHCSCPYCSIKTRNKGHRRNKTGNYNRNLNYKTSELRRLLTMDEEEMEYAGGRIWRPNRCKYESC